MASVFGEDSLSQAGDVLDVVAGFADDVEFDSDSPGHHSIQIIDVPRARSNSVLN
ncbi:hypothetical protein [Haloarcula argentinensis]|uniref:hypothetical protein n=1 Tax=Haloarcula argentinensis TaxID=43776 RepID=UPI001668360B|nr:hypothetical protein [Haloarcula argentinensis]